MNEPIVFNETQQFRAWWIWILLFGIPLFWLFLLFSVQSDTDLNWNFNWGFLMSGIIQLGVGLLFWYIKLETKVNSEGVYYKFKPFQSKFKFYDWESIDQCSVRTYSPIMEYGGWGYRYSFKSGKAYNISGKDGLQLVLKNGDKILIGTQQREHLEKVLIQLKSSTQA